MAKKTSKKASSSRGAPGSKEASGGRKNDRMMAIVGLFTALQEKGAVWYRREREGLVRLEGFQSALLAVRDAQAMPQDGDKDKKGPQVLAGLAGNVVMDPWLAEDLYQQVQELSSGFEVLLEEMYTLEAQASDLVRGSSDDDDNQVPVNATALRPVDYLQMMSQELATFEAEYQHIEALLHLITFDTSTDQLRTLIISWSTSPFLDPEQTRSFFQRHQLSQQLHA
ncbi:unnamed protein product [Hyaloperonospora brassicae]|uniref:BAR domain-containing protein n=1 Tax=Hyaloperonospora brassicae TaxID=162125 RepID=A0AAV0UZC7_HYABA|nr:unnamed protein product [Hyaloperonospora brassicae]